jgi:HK97 family phage prohead protease
LFNHSPNQILGRVSAGTLQLMSENDGLHFEISLPHTSLGNDLHALVSRGDLRECSFAFECRKDQWSTMTVNGRTAQLRTLKTSRFLM